MHFLYQMPYNLNESFDFSTIYLIMVNLHACKCLKKKNPFTLLQCIENCFHFLFDLGGNRWRRTVCYGMCYRQLITSCKLWRMKMKPTVRVVFLSIAALFRTDWGENTVLQLHTVFSVVRIMRFSCDERRTRHCSRRREKRTSWSLFSATQRFLHRNEMIVYYLY